MTRFSDIIDNWLANSDELRHKQDIQTVSRLLPVKPIANGHPVLLGDDAAAIPSQGGYLLIAAEGVWPPLLRANPRLAGRCCVLTNISDIYAMGGSPIAVVDVLFASDDWLSSEVLTGMQENADRFGVPIVGGHYTKNSDTTALAVAILGQAKSLLTSHTARPGDILLLIYKQEGFFHNNFDFWDSSSMISPEQLRSELSLLPRIAEAGLCDTAKDVSMAGILGTTIMLLETSRLGAKIYLDEISYPPKVSIDKWLHAFPSYGFILSVRPEYVNDVRVIFHEHSLCCEPFGTVTNKETITVHSGRESKIIWDLNKSLMGFSNSYLR